MCRVQAQIDVIPGIKPVVPIPTILDPQKTYLLGRCWQVAAEEVHLYREVGDWRGRLTGPTPLPLIMALCRVAAEGREGSD